MREALEKEDKEKAAAAAKEKAAVPKNGNGNGGKNGGGAGSGNGGAPPQSGEETAREIQVVREAYCRETAAPAYVIPEEPRAVVDLVGSYIYGFCSYFITHLLLPVLFPAIITQVAFPTLVKHACDDERVRGHFARIEWFETPDVVRAGGLPGQYLWESGGPEYLGEPRFANAAGPSLLVFEDAWPMDESAWAALASSPTPLGDGSKLLLTCRDADLARLGTADPVVLHKLQRE